jgi:hypothetical protein
MSTISFFERAFKPTLSKSTSFEKSQTKIDNDNKELNSNETADNSPITIVPTTPSRTFLSKLNKFELLSRGIKHQVRGTTSNGNSNSNSNITINTNSSVSSSSNSADFNQEIEEENGNQEVMPSKKERESLLSPPVKLITKMFEDNKRVDDKKMDKTIIPTPTTNNVLLQARNKLFNIKSKSFGCEKDLDIICNNNIEDLNGKLISKTKKQQIFETNFYK